MFCLDIFVSEMILYYILVLVFVGGGGVRRYYDDAMMSEGTSSGEFHFHFALNCSEEMSVTL